MTSLSSVEAQSALPWRSKSRNGYLTYAFCCWRKKTTSLATRVVTIAESFIPVSTTSQVR